MARRNSRINILVVLVFFLASYGGYMLFNSWNGPTTTQKAVKATKKTVDRIDRALEAAKGAW